MRNIIPILFVAATMLVGCHAPSTVDTKTPIPTAVPPARESSTSPEYGHIGVSFMQNAETSALVFGLLREHGIKGVGRSSGGGVDVQVPSDRALEARSLLRDLGTRGHPEILVTEWPPNQSLENRP
jgi:hypothetical protein